MCSWCTWDFSEGNSERTCEGLIFIDVQKMGRIYVLRVCKDLASRLLCLNCVVASKLPLDFDVLEKLCTLWYPGPLWEGHSLDSTDHQTWKCFVGFWLVREHCWRGCERERAFTLNRVMMNVMIGRMFQLQVHSLEDVIRPAHPLDTTSFWTPRVLRLRVR